MIKQIYAILCPALSGVFTLYGGGSGGGNTTTVQKSEPPKAVQPYLQPYMEKAWNVSNQAYQPYQGQRVADLTGEQFMGAGMQSAQALNGFQGQNEANNNYQAMMRGDYLMPESNPFLQANVNKAMGDITSNYRSGTKPQLDAAMSRSGAFGGSAWMQGVNNNERALADSLGAAANQFYGQNYMNERANQMQGLGMMGAMQNLGYTDASKLANAGQAFQGYQQQLLDTQYGDWQEAQNYAPKMLDVFGNAMARTMGGGGSTSSQSKAPGGSNFANALGGGMAGYALGGGLGAGLGGLAGLLL